MDSLKRFIKRRWGQLLAAGAVLLITPQVTHAFELFSITSSAISKIAFSLSWLITLVGGYVILVLGYAVQWVLTLNFYISESPVVRFGFPVMLSLANLAFVFGLIVIALATILRLESYGLKKTLWKLLVIAIAVNFGLVIAGTILSFANNITMFMVKSVNPDENGGVVNFADTFAGTFNPQRSLVTSVKNASPEDIKSIQDAFNVTAEETGQAIKPLVGTIMSIFSMAIIIIALGALVVILLIRYVKIAFLLVTLPLAWASWPFEAYSHNFKDWWKSFTKQAFSPIPLVFFLWLGMITAQNMGQIEDRMIRIKTGSGFAAGLSSTLGNLLTPLADNVLRLILLGGIVMMGLAASESMGAEFARAAQNAIKAGQGRVRKELTSRIQRTAARGGRAIQEKTLGLQKQMVSFRRATVGAVSEQSAAARLAIENVARRAVKNQKIRARMSMEGGIYDKDKNRIGTAAWDHDKHDWKRDAQNDIIDSKTGLALQGGKVKIEGVVFKKGAQTLSTLSGDQADKFGLISGGKPVAEYAQLIIDAAAAKNVAAGGEVTYAGIQDIRAAAALTHEKLDEIIHDYEVKPGDRLSKKEKAVRSARLELQEAAAESPGVIKAVTALPIGDAFAAFAKGGGGGGSHGGGEHDQGAHKEAHPKHDHKKGAAAHH